MTEARCDRFICRNGQDQWREFEVGKNAILQLEKESEQAQNLYPTLMLWCEKKHVGHVTLRFQTLFW